MGRLLLSLVTLFVCCSLSIISVNGREISNVIFPAFSIGSRISGINEPNARTTRQINRRPLTGRPQSPSSNDEEDPFSIYDTIPNDNNQQFSNNGNQVPNQKKIVGNNRPQNQNQKPNKQQNVGNRPQNQNQKPNQQQNVGNRPQNQNQKPNQQQNVGNRPQNQNQSSNNTGNQGQSFQGNNGNNKPSNQNQNQQQISTTTSSNGVSDAERNRCNTSCRDRTTNEYNPVCGSDSMTYQNRQFLNCVASCGIPTEFIYVGTCVPTRVSKRNARRN